MGGEADVGPIPRMSETDKRQLRGPAPTREIAIKFNSVNQNFVVN